MMESRSEVRSMLISSRCVVTLDKLQMFPKNPYTYLQRLFLAASFVGRYLNLSNLSWHPGPAEPAAPEFDRCPTLTQPHHHRLNRTQTARARSGTFLFTGASRVKGARDLVPYCHASNAWLRSVIDPTTIQTSTWTLCDNNR